MGLDLVGRPRMCNEQSVKNVRRKARRIMLKEFENVSAFSNRTEREDMVVYQDHALYLLR